MGVIDGREPSLALLDFIYCTLLVCDFSIYIYIYIQTYRRKVRRLLRRGASKHNGSTRFRCKDKNKARSIYTSASNLFVSRMNVSFWVHKHGTLTEIDMLPKRGLYPSSDWLLLDISRPLS